MNDTRDVKIAMTNASVFAYVADGRNGLRVLEMVSANETAGAFGFSPRAVAEADCDLPHARTGAGDSKGLDRDRAVDESGNQVAVFGRRGGRPFNLEEMQRMFLRSDGKGGKVVWTVSEQDAERRANTSTPGTAAIQPDRRRLHPPLYPSHQVQRR